MFNKRLRQMRMKRNYTQQRLADILDIALRSYQCYETGTRTPNYGSQMFSMFLLIIYLDVMIL